MSLQGWQRAVRNQHPASGIITWVRRAPLLHPRAGGGWEAWAVAGQRGTRRAEDLGDRFWGTFWVEGCSQPDHKVNLDLRWKKLRSC